MAETPAVGSVQDLTELGRARLSEHFFMREMLYSEVANYHGLPNIPEDPDLAVAAGRQLCQLVLEPLHGAFGGIAVRSAYRSPTVNDYCHQQFLKGQRAYYCSDNDYSSGRHIWDRRDAAGYMGATVSIVIPWYLARYEATQDFRPLAWWIRDHIADYAEAIFFPRLCAFNIRWYEGPSERAIYQDLPDDEVLFTKEGMTGFAGDHSRHYPGFPEAPRVSD